MTNINSKIGINVDYPRYWSTHWMFKDVFKHAGVATPNGPVPWISRTFTRWNDGRTLSLDANGWVTSLLSDQQAETIFPAFGGGNYIILYDGVGAVSVNGAREVSRQQGKIIIDTTAYSCPHVRISSTNPANYVRNIRVIKPEFEYDHVTYPFHPLFLERLSTFNCIRAMWLSTVPYNKTTTWASRAPKSYAIQSENRGMAYEYIIELCNTLNQDLWLCIPYLADDDHVTQLATLIKNTLSPNLKVYVEWSNEVWNGEYDVSRYAQAQGLAMGFGRSPFEALLNYQTHRSLQVFSIFENVFVTRERIVRVMGSQVGQQWSHERLLTFESASLHTDALAIAPYFGMPSQAERATFEANAIASGSQWVISQEQNVFLPRAISYASMSASSSQRFNVQLLAYEGGQHLVVDAGSRTNTALVNLYASVNRSPEMGALYTSYLNAWKSMGGQEFCHLSFCVPYDYLGSFGLYERLDQSPPAKMQAIFNFTASNG